MGNEIMLVRANRVAVKSNGDNFVADFYRTHKSVGSIHSEDTEWVSPEDAINKTAQRESFRLWAIANCVNYGIYWKPEDLRTPNNIRNPKYDSDEVLINDAMSMAIDEMRSLVEKCKYGIQWGSIAHEDIIPLTHTGIGRDLSTLGIANGKYIKSGNWAWADIKFVITFKYKGEECYITITMKLVSGQLKKTGMGIMEFNDKIKAELIDAELITEEELNPPKSAKKVNIKDTQEVDEDNCIDISDDIGIDESVVDESSIDTDTKPAKDKSRKSKKLGRR
jgi:hypothetical protein